MKKGLLLAIASMIGFFLPSYGSAEVVQPTAAPIQVKTAWLVPVKAPRQAVCVSLAADTNLTARATALANRLQQAVRVVRRADSCIGFVYSLAYTASEKAAENGRKIVAVQKEVAQIKSCACKKGHKARKHRVVKKRKAVHRRHRTRRPARRVKNNWCKTHRLYQVTNSHLWYRHGCGVESHGGGSSTTTTRNTRPDNDGGTSSAPAAGNSRPDHDGGTSAGSKGDGSNSSNSNSSGGRSDSNGGTAS